MSVSSLPAARRRTRITAALAAISVLILGFALAGTSANQATAAPGHSVYLGAANAKRTPLCPTRCSGLAIVTGFQAKAGGVGNAYRVPFVGQITRWRLTLGKPNRSQRKFFKTNFGARPEAAIAVLAKTVVDGKPVYKLRRRTRIQGLNRYLGKTATFDLATPMKVNKGDFVALIVPTWAPALADPPACEIVDGKMRRPTVCKNFQKNNSWVASRDRSTCMKRPGKNTSQPQLKVNSLVSYGCRFNGALTYGVRVEGR